MATKKHAGGQVGRQASGPQAAHSTARAAASIHSMTLAELNALASQVTLAAFRAALATNPALAARCRALVMGDGT